MKLIFINKNEMTKMNKQILFWCPFLSQVGTINAVIQSALALSKSKNIDCKIMNVFGEFDNYNQLFKKHNIKEIKLIKNNLIRDFPKKGFFWSRFNYILILIFGFLPLLSYLKKNKDDVLIVYLLSSLPFIVISFFDLKNKVIFRISGKIKFSYLRKTIWRYAKKKIQRVLIQTKFAKKRLIEQRIFEKKKILYIEDPIIDLKKINFLKKQKIENKFLKKDFYVAIGRLTHQKNFSFLIKNIQTKINNNNFHLLILGDGEEKLKLSQMIEDKKLKNKIHLLGYKKNIYKYLDKSKGLICTSLWEEPGFIIQEAAACKKIILASDCDSGPSEFLENGKYGFIFKTNNPKSFIANLSSLIENKKKHKKMIEKNYKKIFNYTKDSFVKKMTKELDLIDSFNKT